MKKHFLLLLFFTLASSVFLLFSPQVPVAHLEKPLVAVQTNVSIFEQPQATELPILEKMKSARQEIFVEVYLLSDKEIIAALQEAQARGVTVKVLLEKHPYEGGSLNAHSAESLKSAGVSVNWTNPLFALTHQKSIVIDGSTAFILNQNLTASAFTKNREYNVIDTNAEDVTEVRNIFLADWERHSFQQTSDHLVVSPDNARPALKEVLQNATQSIDMEMEVFTDPEMQSLLASKAKTVKVRLILPDLKKIAANEPTITKLQQAGIQIHTLHTPYLHAKMILVDQRSAYVGSINFTTQSLDKNRELGIVLSEEKSITQLKNSFEEDWAQSDVTL